MTRETLVFRVATAAVLVHALDDAFVHRGPGLGLGQHALAGLIAVIAGVAGAIAFPRLRPGLRAALAFSFGVLAVANGVLHVIHVAQYGPTGGDLTGMLAAVGGAVLVALAVAIPWRHRGEGTAIARVIAVPLGIVVLLFVLVPVGMGVVATHKWREPVGEPPSRAYRDVGFKASDGLDNGSENNYGWDWAKDIAGALAFLHGREDVDPGRIGALGLSTGADVLIEVAAKRRDVAALVTDGAAAGSFEDGQRLSGTSLETPIGWTMFTTIRVLSGDAPGPPLEDMIARVRAPTLMISAGEQVERDYNVLYERAASGPVEHWNLPSAQHTRAIREHPEEYERRVVSFFDAALAGGLDRPRAE
jgi:uncharacterized protein